MKDRLKTKQKTKKTIGTDKQQVYFWTKSIIAKMLLLQMWAML